jgi:hypothetical protein
MAILAFCQLRRIIVAFACKRKNDPSDKEIGKAFSGAESSSAAMCDD